MARIATGLALHQNQTLAPAQQQALAVLQLPADRLAALIEAELAENPLLRRRDDLEPRVPAPRHRGFVIGRGGLPMTATAPGIAGGRVSSTLDEAAERIADPGPGTLRAHLAEQLRLEIADPLDRAVGLHLIDLLASTGYLEGDPADIAPILGTNDARVASVLERMRGFEPAGVFARDLADCLRLQLDPAERSDPAWQALLANLAMVASGDRDRLARACDVAPECLATMLRRLRALDPKPGLRFDTAPVEWTVPDLLVEQDPAGHFRVRLNPETMPACEIDSTTYRRLTEAARRAGDKQGLRTRHDSARGLIAAIERRGATLLAIGDAIVRRQRGFFASGIAELRTLTRRDVARRLDLDQSTISRAVAGKTMATPRGTFGLEFFFDRGIAAGPGEPVSAARIRHRLTMLIASETQPLTDAALARQLAAEGIDVARRTVAKYRESLNLPPAHTRRRMAGSGRRRGTPDGS